jgi:predicted esterase
VSAAAPQLDFVHVFEPGASGWTLLLLHGTGGDEHDLLGLGRKVAPGAALLSPRGKVLEAGMPRFFRRLAVGQLDIPDLLVRADELAAFVTAATAAYELDPQRIVALGLSNGANVAVAVLFRHGGLLRGAALLRAMLPYEPGELPQLAGTDVLIAAGASDPFSSVEQVERLKQLLVDGGATVELRIEPGGGHQLRAGDLSASASWMDTLSGGRARVG